jgi:type IV secretion system protein VirD4
MKRSRVRIGYWDRTCAETLWYPGDTHLTLTAPAGSGKFRDVLSGIGALWPGSLVWIDPKLQAGAVLARHISKTHNVQFLNPFNILPEFLGRFPHARMNVMSTLDPSQDSFGADCESIAEGIVVEEGNSADMHFPLSAKDGWAGTISALAKHGHPKEKNLAVARGLICGRDFFEFCRMTAANTDDEFIRQKLGRFTPQKIEENREILGIVSTMITQSAFVGNKAIANNMSASTFRWRDLKKRPTCIFLGLPARYLATCSRWFRLTVASAMNELLHEERGVPVLMVLDEFAQLGRLKVIENAMALARGYGVQLLPVLQDLNQLRGLYAQSWETFLANAGCRMFFGPHDKFTSDYLSSMCSDMEVRGVSKSMGQGPDGRLSVNLSHVQQRRPYLTPAEVRELPGDEMIVLADGIPGVIRAGRRPYYRCPELRGMYDPDPYQNGGGNGRRSGGILRALLGL